MFQGPAKEGVETASAAQRTLADLAIEEKAKELTDSGLDSFMVQNFRKGAREELTRQLPDFEKYKQANQVAAAYKQRVTIPG
jgi:hypothetical protein